MSVRQVAREINVHPSSLGRALHANAMSGDMAVAAAHFLESFTPSSTATKKQDLKRALHLLHELNRVTPGLQAVLENMLDGSDAVK